MVLIGLGAGACLVAKRPSFWIELGSRLGKALLSAVARVAVERGCPRYEWAVLDWNTPALDFYKAKGARALDEWIIHRTTGQALKDLASQAPTIERM